MRSAVIIQLQQCFRSSALFLRGLLKSSDQYVVRRGPATLDLVLVTAVIDYATYGYVGLLLMADCVLYCELLWLLCALFTAILQRFIK